MAVRQSGRFAEFVELGRTHGPGARRRSARPRLGQRRPAWIPDVVVDSNFPRAAAAERVGLHSAFALPILRGDDVVGVMEFFSGDIREPDTALLDTMMAAGAQIGLYAAGKWAADELDAFFTLSPDLLCVASLEGYFLRLNPAWTQVLGFADAELQATPFIDFVHPDDRAATLAAMARADRRRTRHQLREPLSHARRLVSMARLGRRRPLPSGASSTRWPATSPNARRRAKRCSSRRNT